MRKPNFGVTAFAVITLSVLGFFRVSYEPLLPPSTTEYLVSIPSSDPRPAPIVEIAWKHTVEEGQAEAKRRKLGMLILFIAPSNIYAKQVELKVFRNPEMARFVSRTFVPVKVNLDEYPEWNQFTQPLQRLGHYYEPGVEVVVANYDGALINHYVVDNPFQYYGPESVLPFLIQSKTLMNQGASFIQSDESLQSLQNSDIRSLINASTEPVPAFSVFGENLLETLKMRVDGDFKPGSTKVSPMALRLLAKLGRSSFSAATLRQLALTPLYDPIDGGFYREARISPNSSYIDTSKSSNLNALMAQVAAQLACANNDRELKQLSIDIGNTVISDFLNGDSISTSRMNDQFDDMRSARSSLTEKKLSSILNPSQRSTLMSFLTKARSPEQNLVSLRSLSALSDPKFLVARQVLKENLRSVPGLSAPDHIANDGYLAARLFDLYRYTDDPRFLTKGTELSEDAFSALSEASVSKIYGNRELGGGWLASYLALADCGLSSYAATGEIYPLRKGEAALKLAISRFKDSNTGLLNNVAGGSTSPSSLRPSFPDLADCDRESLNSQAIRLAFHYSITSESETTRAEFLAFSQSMLVRLNSVMHSANITASGYFDAAYDVVANTSLMVAGPNRVNISNKLAKKYPFRLVYPMSVVNSPPNDLLYIRQGETLDGPYSLEEIEKKMNRSGGS